MKSDQFGDVDDYDSVASLLYAIDRAIDSSSRYSTVSTQRLEAAWRTVMRLVAGAEAPHRRGLDNLRGDATTAVAEFGYALRGFLFDRRGVLLDTERPFYARDGVLHDDVCRTLRGMGWRAEVVECDDGETRVLVEVER